MKKLLKKTLIIFTIIFSCLLVSSCTMFTPEYGDKDPDTGDKDPDGGGNTEVIEMNEKIINVYLIAGQSNAVGYGMDDDYSIASSDQRVIDGYDNVLYYGAQERWDNEKLNVEFQPVKFGMGAYIDRCGAELGIAKAIADNEGMNAIIKCAWGSTHIFPDMIDAISYEQGTWTPPTYIKNHNFDLRANELVGRMYRWWQETVSEGIKLLIDDGYTPVIKGLWWMQGCAEMYSAEQSAAYEELLKTLIVDMRNEISNITGSDYSQMPFVFGLPNITENPYPVPYQAAVRTAMKNVANDASVINADYIDCDNDEEIKKPYDIWHFDGKGQVYLGETFVSKLNNLNEHNPKINETISIDKTIDIIDGKLVYTASVTNYNKENKYSYGIITVPTSDLIENNITGNYIEELNSNNIEFYNNKSNVEIIKIKGDYTNSIIKSNVAISDNNTSLTSIAYIVDEDGNYCYSNPSISHSKGEIASELLYSNVSEAVKNDLANCIDDNFELVVEKNLNLAYSQTEYSVNLNLKQSPNMNYFVKYTSANPEVAKVDSEGNVTPLKHGITNITIECGGKTETVKVTVGDVSENEVVFDGVINSNEYPGSSYTANNNRTTLNIKGKVVDGIAYLAFEITHGNWSMTDNQYWHLNDNIEFYLGNAGTDFKNNDIRKYTVIFYDGVPTFSQGIDRAFVSTKQVNGKQVTTVELCVLGIYDCYQLKVGLNGNGFGWLGAIWDFDATIGYLTKDGIKVNQPFAVNNEITLDGNFTESFYTDEVKTNIISTNANGAQLNIMGTLTEKGVVFGVTINHTKAANISTNNSSNWYTFLNIEFHLNNSEKGIICTAQNKISHSRSAMYSKTVQNGSGYTTTMEVFIPYESFVINNDYDGQPITFACAGWFETGWSWLFGNSWNSTHKIYANGIFLK